MRDCVETGNDICYLQDLVDRVLAGKFECPAELPPQFRLIDAFEFFEFGNRLTLAIEEARCVLMCGRWSILCEENAIMFADAINGRGHLSSGAQVKPLPLREALSVARDILAEEDRLDAEIAAIEFNWLTAQDLRDVAEEPWKLTPYVGEIAGEDSFVMRNRNAWKIYLSAARKELIKDAATNDAIFSGIRRFNFKWTEDQHRVVPNLPVFVGRAYFQKEDKVKYLVVPSEYLDAVRRKLERLCLGCSFHVNDLASAILFLVTAQENKRIRGKREAIEALVARD